MLEEADEYNLNTGNAAMVTDEILSKKYEK